MNHSSYLTVLDRNWRELRLDRAMAALSSTNWDYSAIASSGLSGNLFSLPLADRLGKDLIVVRKQQESNHGQVVEGSAPIQPGLRYIIVDDFSSSGDTISWIKREVESCYSYKEWRDVGPWSEASWTPPTLIGVLLYADSMVSQLAISDRFIQIPA